MKEVTPRVEIIAETKMDYERLQSYLNSIGATEYDPELAESDGESLIMAAGKACYRSWQPGLNPNVTKTRNDAKEYIGNIITTGHGSVLEHTSVSFLIYNVSRVFTHELVRHRVGTAFSQESLRFVRLEDIGFWIPQILKDEDNEAGEGIALIKETVEYLESVQKKLAEIYQIDERKNFAMKKKLTSAFRRVAPVGVATCMVFSMNLRTARHLIPLRTSRHAEEEIRLVFSQIAEILIERFPDVFQDFHFRKVSGYREWYAENASQPYDKSDYELRKLEQQIEDLEEQEV